MKDLYVKCERCGARVLTGRSVPPIQPLKGTNISGPCSECGAKTKFIEIDVFYADGTPYRP